jgi:ubiquinone/menaquinone biosynthesis C-methylase UbiE
MPKFALETPSYIETDNQYWDWVASQCFEEETRVLKENLHKKREIVDELLNYDLTGQKILEIGCGAGTVGSIMDQCYSQLDYTPMDFSEKFAKIAKKITGKKPLIGRITDLPFPDKSFTMIWLFDVLEHIDLSEREKGYSEVSRVLTEHGNIFINNPVRRRHHDDRFDHGFSTLDLARFCEDTNMEIFTLRMYVSKDLSSQFIGLCR